MRYKGKYIARVIIDFDVEKREGIRPLCEIRNGVTPFLKEILQDEVGDLGTVEVNQEYMDLYEKEEEE